MADEKPPPHDPSGPRPPSVTEPCNATQETPEAAPGTPGLTVHVSTPDAPAPDAAQPPAQERPTGTPVIGFQDRKRRQAGHVHVPEDLRQPERNLPVKLTKNQLKERRKERRRLAHQLWLQDLPYVEIGRQLGVASSTAEIYVKSYTRLIDRPREQSVQASRAKHVSQLAQGKRIMMGIALNPQVFAKDRVAAFGAFIQATAEQARLNGEHAPVKVASTTPDGERWAPLQAHLTKLSTEDVQALLRLADVRLLPEASLDAHYDAEGIMDAEVVMSPNGTDGSGE